MPTFKDLASLMKYLNASINDALQNEVAPVVEAKMKEKIKTEVYDAYTPREYQRRYELGSEGNISSELISDGVLLTKNTADPSPSVIGTPYGSSGSTTFPQWVNDGFVPNIFNDRDYPWMHPRDFIGATVDELKSSGEVATALAKGLAGKGIRTTVNVKRGG